MRNLAYWLLLILVFIIPWENMVVIQGLGTISRILGMGLMITWLVHLIIAGKVRRPHPIHIAALAFLIWNLAGFFWTPEYNLTLTKTISFIQLGMFMYILWDLCRTHNDLIKVMQAFILGAYISIASIFYNFYFGVEYTYNRYAAGGFDANDVGLIFALGIPLAWYLITNTSRKNKNFKWVNIGYIPLALYAILLTASRNATMALLAGFLFILWSLRGIGFWRLAAVVASLAGVIILVAMLGPQQSLERLGTIPTEIAGGTLNSRTQIWQAGLQVFADNPLLGVGGGVFAYAVQPILLWGVVAHNSFLSVLVEYGIIGFSLFIGVWFTAFHSVIQQPHKSREMWLAILAVLVIGASTLTWEYRKPVWLFLSTAVISTRCTTSLKQEEDGNAEPNTPLLTIETGLKE